MAVHEVVPEHRARRTAQGARRPLRRVAVVARHAILGPGAWLVHLEAVELRGHLAQVGRISHVKLELEHISGIEMM